MTRPPDPEPAAQSPRSLAFLLLFAGVAVLVLGLLLWPFLLAILSSAVTAVLTYPIYRFVRRGLKNPSLAAGVTLWLVSIGILIPSIALGTALIGGMRSGVEALSAQVGTPQEMGFMLIERLEVLVAPLGLDANELVSQGLEQLRGIAGQVPGRSLALLSGFGGWLFQAGIASFTLFFLLRDGESLLETIRWLVPIDPALTSRLLEQSREVLFATVYGNLGVAAAQGLIGGLAFWAVGLPHAPLWGTVMGTLSLLPLVGAAIIWVPAGVGLLMTGEVARGLILLAVGVGIISTVDNYLRAFIVGGRTELHPLNVLLSVLGGLVLFGAAGVFLGPVLFVVAISLIEMARAALEEPTGEAHLFRKHPVRGRPPEKSE